MSTDPTENLRWKAIQNRDRSMDGVFVYCVRSTGIVCRPSCPSRPARAENVVFHETVEAAREGGFRPCLRCRPDKPETWVKS
ncbi:Ada metal-binding domain-containing protein [Rhizobium glycinendophyticum]|uniref:Ada metal-binding domain-containing protein n=1 Tax=Rhizobium glycinendophyticum TaxID=2589807 RepID=A0A504UHN9_9HYPH|nr:Ada metal-binding domain-containing protein [Rhizobium glycinendophyticum]TPP10265.1 Ada metal-binding domain-containing protein [Rhizobium glycinendophyticum]